MKRKGFTLIELLAVIVVLAIIALIAVPTILGIIEKSRKGAAESSAYGFVDAIEKSIIVSEVSGQNVLTDGLYNNVNDFSNIDIKGQKPDKISVCISNNKVKTAMFEFDKRIIKYDGNKAITVDKFEEVNCSEEKIPEIVTNYTAEEIEAAENIFSMGDNNSVVGKYDPETKNLIVTKNGSNSDGIIINRYGMAIDQRFGYNYGNPTGESINNVIIEQGITTLKEGSFEDIRVNKVSIPASVTMIEERAFYRNSGLKEISVSLSNKNYKSVDGVLYTKDNSILLAYPFGSERTTYTVLDGTKRLGCVSLAHSLISSNLIDVYLPNSVSETADFAFWGSGFKVHYCGSANLYVDTICDN